MRVLSWNLGLRPSHTRLPFKYGEACLTDCPQALLCTEFLIDGRTVAGYAADCLPPLWFDKDSSRTFEQQIEDMQAVIALASQQLLGHGEFQNLFDALECLGTSSFDLSRPRLLHSFGISMVERCIIDALCRYHAIPFRKLLSSGGLYGDQSLEVMASTGERRRLTPWQRDLSRNQIYVRHTVGMGDPLTTASIPESELINDGRPQALEDYLKQDGVRFLKIKVGNRGADDVSRIKEIDRLLTLSGIPDYGITIDGNEQYETMGAFIALMDELNSDRSLTRFMSSVLAIEQPIVRSKALERSALDGIDTLVRTTPVIIDESDSEFSSCLEALDLGYSGTSSKACKGVTKALINRQLIADRNRIGERPYLMTGEDLCCVGIVSLQADLALVSAMGLEHVERNGHHYHPGLAYLPESSYDSVLSEHSDLYQEVGGIPSVKVEAGQLQLESVNASGFGYSARLEFDAYRIVAHND